MMSNLFSIFDPSMSVLGYYLLCPFFSVLFFSSFFWFSGFLGLFFSRFFSFFSAEVDYSISDVKKGTYGWFCSVFVMIFSLNFFSMFPYFFSCTSHLLFTFPFSFSMWFCIVLFLWSYYFLNFLSHMIPSGTPLSLISFMVLVEMVSGLIRPIALTFRLTANMMAGHLLMSLIGGLLINMSFTFMVLGMSFQWMLVFMELGVSFIQSYVFTTLLVLYCSEISSH